MVGALGCQTASPLREEKQKEQALLLAAQAQLALADGQAEKALKLFAQALRQDPTSAELREEYGLALANLGITEEALTQLRQARNLSAEGEAVLGLLAAQRAASREELQEAVGHLEKGLAYPPYGDRIRQTLMQSYLRLGEGQKAWELISQALGEAPENPTLHLMAGIALRQLGKLAEAEDHLRKARASQAVASQATGELVEVLAQQGKFKEAADLVGEAVKAGGAPTLPGLVRWATLLLRAREVAKAEEVLEEALRRDPNYTDALLLRASVAFRQGKAEEAERLYRRALATAPQDPDALLGLARVLLEVRRLPEARSLLLQARSVVERSPEALPGALEEVVEEQAACELLARDYAAALPFLQKLAAKPLSRRGVALWGEYFRAQERFAEGLEFLRKAQVEEQEQARLLSRAFQGEFLLAAGEREKGLEELSSLASGEVAAVHMAVSAANRQKLYSQAILWAREGLRRFPEDGELTFLLAAALERSGQFQEAVATFRQLLAKEPDNASALNYLGYMFADRGENLQEAKELIEKAVALDPLSGAYLDSLGWVYFRLGDLDRAEKHLTQALALEPFDPTVHEHLGDLYRARGEVAKAKQAYEQALRLKPDEEGQEERIREKLAQLAAGQ
jgi:tetratricopeptide (TPR) repeat protein